LECFLETAKIALKGRKKKFESILSDGSLQIVEIDGDEFSEYDYGIVVDNSNGAQELNQKLDMLAQAALQNQTLDFSAIMKLYTTKSLAEKQRIIEESERRRREAAERQQQQEMQMQQAQLQQQTQIEQARSEQAQAAHREDNEVKILVAQINAMAEEKRFAMMNHDNDEANTLEREKMAEDARQFDARLKLDSKKQNDDVRIKEKELQVKKASSNKSK
jgi:membrane protein involved in colicin uptake